jgi:hypothetical protein
VFGITRNSDRHQIGIRDRLRRNTHRIRNFEEDLDREFWKNGQAVVNIGMLDLTRPRISVTLSSNRHTGSALRFIEKQLVRHNLAEIAAVSKLEPALPNAQKQK